MGADRRAASGVFLRRRAAIAVVPIMSFVVGFDLSLTAPAAVAIPLNWRPGDWKRVKSWLARPIAPRSDDPAGGLRRYRGIADWACALVEEVGGDRGLAAHVFIEQYAFSRNNAQASKLMELGGIVRIALFDRFGLVPHVVATSSARKLLLDKVPRADQKAHTQAAFFKLGAPKTWDENQIDAMCVANFGLTELGRVALTVAGG